MTKKMYSLLTILFYGLIQLSPLFIRQLNMISTNEQLFSYTALSYLAGVALLTFVYIKSRPLSIEMQPITIGRCIAWGIAGIFLAILLQGLASQVESLIFNTPPTSQNTQDIVEIIKNNQIFMIVAAIGAPIMEEFVFRRAIFGALADTAHDSRFGIFLAALASSLLFAFAHQDGHILLLSLIHI